MSCEESYDVVINPAGLCYFAISQYKNDVAAESSFCSTISRLTLAEIGLAGFHRNTAFIESVRNSSRAELNMLF